MPRDIQVHRIDPQDPAEVDAVLGMDQLVWADDLRTPRAAALGQSCRCLREVRVAPFARWRG